MYVASVGYTRWLFRVGITPIVARSRVAQVDSRGGADNLSWSCSSARVHTWPFFPFPFLNLNNFVTRRLFSVPRIR